MKVFFKNYRCLRDAELQLTPLTVILGPNASGKSAIVHALDPEVRPLPHDVWQRRPNQLARIHRRWADGELVGRSDRSPPELQGKLYRFQRLQLELSSMRRHNVLSEAARLATDGANLTNTFATLPRTTQSKLAADYCQLVPVFADVDARPSTNGQHRLLFQDRWNPNAWYEPEQVSDGSMLALAFLLLPYQQPPVEVLAIEELERGLHPYLIGDLVKLLRRMATGELGQPPMHVVLTTHSASLLEFVQPEEVRLLERKDDGSVEIREVPSDTEHWKRAYEEYGRSFGSMWLSGGLGGTP